MTKQIKRPVSFLLAVLMIVGMFAAAPFTASAAPEDLTYNELTTYTDYLNTGDQWYNKYGLSNATGNSDYQSSNAAYYLSTDDSTIKIDVTVSGDTTTEYHERTTEPLYFDYLLTVPAFGEALPSSPDGLADGTKWFDKAGLVDAIKSLMGENYEYLYVYEDADYYLSVDGTILRRLYANTANDELVVDNPWLMSGFIREVGVDPFAGFTLLPKSADGLSDGDYWFAVDELTAALDAETAAAYAAASYYLSEDGNTMKIVMSGLTINAARDDENWSFFFSFLRQVGVSPVFTVLPTSDEGLSDGELWFDAAGLAALFGDDDFLGYTYSISDDGNTIRMSVSGGSMDVERTSEYGPYFFRFLRVVGVDPTDTFVPVYYSAEQIDGCSGFLFNVEGFLDQSIENENADRAGKGQDPLTPAEEEEIREETRGELANASIAIDPMSGIIQVTIGADVMTFDPDSPSYSYFADYIDYVENHAWDDGVVTTDPTADDAGVRTFTCKKCGATKTEAAKDVFWAGYEHQFDAITLDEGDKPVVAAHNIFVITKKDTLKVQLRFASGSTLTFSRDGVGGGRAVSSISDVVYDGTPCELWVVDYALDAGTYTAVAKMKYIKPIGDIQDVYGCTFEIDAPTCGTAVYSIEIGAVDPDYGFIVFDGKTKQVITAVTGTDVQKIQLRNDATGSTLTYNASNATIVEDTLEDGTPVLVWTIERLFARGEFSFSVYTRSILGLTDSGKDLAFTIGALSDDMLLVSVDVAVDAENGKDVFTVVTQTSVSKVKFTDTATGATITATKTGTDKIAVSIANNDDGKTMTWTITVNHHPGHTYGCQALLGNIYTNARQVSVPADPAETLLFSVDNAVDEAKEYVTFTVVTHKDAAKVRLTNTSNGGTITALPGGNDKVAVTISDPNDAGQKTWTITVKYLTKTADVTYECQAFIGETFQSEVKETTVKAPEDAPAEA